MSSVKKIQTRIQLNHDFEVNWIKAINFIPLAGELVVYNRETDPSTGAVLTTKINGVDKSVIADLERTTAYDYARFKLGDGLTKVNDLAFVDATLLHGLVDIQKEITSIQGNVTEVQNNLDTMISCGTEDPSGETASKFYFKYSVN